MRILLVEDSERLSGAMATGLRHEGFAVDVARDGASGLHLGVARPYDVIVLDLMLPVLNGLAVLERLRASNCAAAVLILSARGTTEDVLAGLNAGADDYMTKPFAWYELVARIHALLRRRFQHTDTVLRASDLEFFPRARIVRVRGQTLPLTRRETAVLEYLLHRKGETATHAEIEAAIYDRDSSPTSNSVTTIVCRLRKQLRSAPGAPPIHTVRGLGYRIDDVDDSAEP